jgi:hypothetical protein
MNNFNVRYPIEVVEDWVKETGVEDGAILTTQDVLITNVELDITSGYVIIEGNLEQKVMN